MKLSLALLSSALLVAGCESSTSSAPTAPAAPAMAATPPAATNVPAAAPKMTMPMMTDGVSDKECSHMLTQDEPVFTTMPGAQGVAPIGMIKSGTKVLVMAPGKVYTQCMMGGGKTVYIKTSSLKPTTN